MGVACCEERSLASGHNQGATLYKGAISKKRQIAIQYTDEGDKSGDLQDQNINNLQPVQSKAKKDTALTDSKSETPVPNSHKVIRYRDNMDGTGV